MFERPLWFLNHFSARDGCKGWVDFDTCFHDLTGNPPFQWQRRFFKILKEGGCPRQCDLPTATGKTSVIAIWLIALSFEAAEGAVKLPRRLVYVVDRRAIIDQASDEALTYVARLTEATEDSPLGKLRSYLRLLAVDPQAPLRVSPLRGQRADNHEWVKDPSGAAIIVGTVDMVGSRLLFSGYGASFRTQAMHAGLVGQDSILVLDEGHLSPAFSVLQKDIREAQLQSKELRPVQVLELTATHHGMQDEGSFCLGEEDLQDPIIAKRVLASKTLQISDSTDKTLVKDIVAKALTYADSKTRVLIYVLRPRDAEEIANGIRKGLKKKSESQVALLTGTKRGYERDLLSKTNLFKAFASPQSVDLPATYFLVSTSAGEVGVNITADAAVMDLTPLDSMIQRFGRINRFGENADSKIDVLAAFYEKSKNEEYDESRYATFTALHSLPEKEGTYDASPWATRALLVWKEAFTPLPHIVPLTDFILDGWSCTSVKVHDDEVRPQVAPYLRGISSNEPTIDIGWREEIDYLPDLDEDETLKFLPKLGEWFNRHKIKPHELLSITPSEFKKKILRLGAGKAVFLRYDGSPQILDIEDLQDDTKNKGKKLGSLRGGTLILGTQIGGLSEDGLFDGSSRRPAKELDVADAVDGNRCRYVQVGGERFDLGLSLTTTGTSRYRFLFPSDPERDDAPVTLVSASRMLELDTVLESETESDGEEPLLKDHLHETATAAQILCRKAGILDTAYGQAVVLAALVHDLGKARHIFQRALAPWSRDWVKNGALAKSLPGFRGPAVGGYRHEFGSLHDIRRDTERVKIAEEDLFLHLVASHHGRGRPHFTVSEVDGEASPEDNRIEALAQQVRFAELQAKYGRWTLAWIEAILKASDALATTLRKAVLELDK